MNHIISVNDKCIGCSLCINDCPQLNIELEYNKAKIKSQDCLKCGHCSAICPEEAIEISGYDDIPIYIDNLNKIKPAELLNSIMSRRSIRQFKDKKISNEDIEKIIEADRWTPTAKNSQDITYILIDKEKKKLEGMAVNTFRKLVKFVKIFNKSYRDFTIDDDFFFKKAPLVIGIVANSQVDGALVASSMSLMAESLELGVLYSGFFCFASRLSFKLKRELGLKKKKLVTTLVIGYPNVKYKRTTQKDNAKIIYK